MNPEDRLLVRGKPMEIVSAIVKDKPTIIESIIDTFNKVWN